MSVWIKRRLLDVLFQETNDTGDMLKCLWSAALTPDRSPSQSHAGVIPKRFMFPAMYGGKGDVEMWMNHRCVYSVWVENVLLPSLHFSDSSQKTLHRDTVPWLVSRIRLRGEVPGQPRRQVADLLERKNWTAEFLCFSNRGENGRLLLLLQKRTKRGELCQHRAQLSRQELNICSNVLCKIIKVRTN